MKPLPPLKVPKVKGRVPKAPKVVPDKWEKIGGKIGDALKKKGKKVAEGVGAAIGKRIRSAVGLPPVKDHRKNEARTAGRSEERQARHKSELSSAAAAMGHAGKGSPHEISSAERARRRRSMRENQKSRWL